jgi:hypothetical protein
VPCISNPQISVYVRPCAIGEYLSPTLDLCLACAPGLYNFNHTATTCSPCDTAAALCSDDQGAAAGGGGSGNGTAAGVAGGTQAAAGSGGGGVLQRGMIVPLPGFWHSNFFSEQVTLRAGCLGSGSDARACPPTFNTPLTYASHALPYLPIPARWRPAPTPTPAPTITAPWRCPACRRP